MGTFLFDVARYVGILAALAGLLSASGSLLWVPTAAATPARVLWWDVTEEFGGQAANSLRRAMSDYLTSFSGGTVFNSTYVDSTTPGGLAAELAANTYDVIVFDATRFDGTPSTLNSADLGALSSFYASHRNVLLDGVLYIRSIDYNATTIFPGPNGATGAFTVNEVYQLANRGGGVMIGTDHNCCQLEPNRLLQAMIPLASFAGSTFPSLDGQFNGDDLLNAIALASPFDLFTHWDSVPTEAITPTGTFTDIGGASVTLYSQVDVADDPGGGPRFSYVSTSWQPGGVAPEFDCNDNGILDSIDIQNGTSQDANGNGIPDECDPPIVTETIVLAPASDVNFLGESHTVTATVTDGNGQPVVGRQVTFEVISGPHAGLTGTADTAADGTATFMYTGTATGIDMIRASFVDSSSQVQISNSVTKEWLAPPDACSSTPATGCRLATQSGRGGLLIKKSASGDGDKLVWEWRRGQQTTLSDLGDPLTGTTSYALCVYDENGGGPTLALSAAAPAASECSGACWSRVGTRGLNYVDRTNTPDGIRRMVIRANRDGRSRILVKAKGPNLGVPALPLAQDTRVRVQLVNSNGVCWEGGYSQPAVRNDRKIFRDKVD